MSLGLKVIFELSRRKSTVFDYNRGSHENAQRQTFYAPKEEKIPRAHRHTSPRPSPSS